MIRTDELWNGQWEAVMPDWEPDDPIGHGPTEAAAIGDLRIQMQCEECDDERTALYRIRPGVCSRLCALHKPYWARP
jgi:hypothetical protein